MNDGLNASTAIIRARQHRLLAWFDQQKRDLPWRRLSSLYGTWIAETMLQQTTVATVAKRWPGFLNRFPDVQTLAGAAESDVLTAWSGLGYYRRARWLHQAAQQVVSERQGRLPSDLSGWRALPGVGEYSAAAITSIGLGLPVPVVDVNVHRVLLRWYFADGRSAARILPSGLWELADANLVRDRPADGNQALMDLGAGLCRAAATDCLSCPVRTWCAAGLAGTSAKVPQPVQRLPARRVQLSVLALRRGERTLWLPSEKAMVVCTTGLGRPWRASLTGLLTGMWSMPMTPWYSGFDQQQGQEQFLSAWRRWLRALGWKRADITAAGWYRHAITSHRLHVLTVLAFWPGDLPRPVVPGADWLSNNQLPPLSSITRKSLAVVEKANERMSVDK